MPEHIQPPQSEFVQTFDAMRTVVTNPDVSFVPFRDPLGPKLSTPPEHVPNYVVIQGKLVPMQHLGDPVRMDSYERWETSRPDLTETFPSFDELSDTDRRAYDAVRFLRHGRFLEGDSPTARYWLAAEWMPYVKTTGDMAHVLKYVFDQNVYFLSTLTPPRHQQRGMSYGRHITHGSIALSLKYAGQPDASLMTDAIHQSLAPVPPDEREDFINRIYSPIGKALIHDRANSYTAVSLIAEELTGEELVQGVRLYDEAGLISDKFWPRFGVVAKAAVATPEFASMLAGKLTGPDGERLVQEYLPYPSQAARAYMTEVFTAYANDPNRNQSFANHVLEATTPSVRQAGVNIDPSALINEANQLAINFNQGVDKRGGDPSEKFAILKDELTFVSDAFLRLMGLTRRINTPQAVQAKQWEQDIHQAEIVGALLGRGSETKISDADVALRFPGLDQRQRQIVRRLMIGEGGKLLDALQAAQQSVRQDPPGNRG